MKQRFPPPPPLIGTVIRWHLALGTWQMLKATSLSLGHFCGFISCIPAGPPGCNSYDSGRAVFSKCCWLISPAASPWSPNEPITAHSCFWSPSAFSRCSWEGHKMAQGQLSLATVVYIWSMGSIPTTEASCFWLDVAEMSAAPFKEG